MAKYSTVKELINIFKQCHSKTRISSQVWAKLKQLNISKKVRGCRAGVRKIRPIKTIINPRHDNCNFLRGINPKNLLTVPVKSDHVWSNKLTLGYCNARSVKNKTQEINDLICDNKLDILCITETWMTGSPLDDLICNELTPPGYKIVHVPREQGRGGGVAVIYRSSLKCQSQSKHRPASFEALELLLSTKSDCIRLCVIYRPPVGGKHSKPMSMFLDEFQEYIDRNATTTGKLLLIGDFNIHMESKEKGATAKFHELIQNLNLLQHVKNSTHIQGHMLDIVLTRATENLVTGIDLHPSGLSDHFPIFVRCVVDKPAAEIKLIACRNIKGINISQLKNDVLSTINERTVSDVAGMIDNYNSTLSNVLSMHAPRTVKKVAIRNQSPWYNGEIRALKSSRRQAERRWLKSRLAVDWDMLQQKRSNYNQMCNKTKENYFKAKIEENKGDQKALFNIISAVKKDSKTLVLPSHSCPSELANNFADFFEEKVIKISQMFPQVSVLPHPIPPEGVKLLTSLQPTTEKELRKIIMNGNSKGCCLDPIPTPMLKSMVDVLLPWITEIVNASISQSYVPDNLKMSSVTPRIKKPSLDAEQMKNYRPVSNLPYIAKLVEKVVVNQLDRHLLENDLYASHQSAYRKHHSCETALVKICNDIQWALDSNKCVLLILIDQSAAFDTVNQDLLLHRLQTQFGINAHALQWFASYLKGRTQAVKVGEMHSEAKPLPTGFPQGSVLGPYMYPLYTIPLFNIAEKHNISIHMYADDTQLYITCDPKDFDAAVLQLEKTISEVKKWMTSNHLKLNEDKTEYLIIAKKSTLKRIKNTEINVGPAKIISSKMVKNIGGFLDQNMSMEEQVKNTIRTCYSQLRQIAHIRPSLTKDATKILINTTITSRMDFLNSLLYGVPKAIIEKMQLVQNNAARLIFRKKRSDHVTSLLQELHWLPIEFRINYKINLLTFKSLQGYAPKYLQELLIPYRPNRSLRSASKGLLMEHSTKTKHGDRSYRACAPKMWNTLPEDVKCAKDMDSFKRKLKTYYFRLYFKC